jgi:hypothetical protein
MTLLRIFAFLFIPVLLAANGTDPGISKKTHFAVRLESSIQVDGQLDELAWQQVPPTSDFTQFSPNPGAAPSQPTEVWILYDDAYLYLGARLYDSRPDSILMEMDDRDRLGNTDYFGIILDPYQDGINGFGFFVTSAGVQYDIRYSALDGGGNPDVRDGDTNWDAVWESAVQLDNQGWVVELKIPYSAIRFPDSQVQRWNVNFFRSIRRLREDIFWNSVDPNLNGLMNQSGQLEGIRDVKAPVRFQATPFIAGYVDNLRDPNSNPSSNWTRSFNGGMDIRYGLTDAFTLDMTLIPDFGEAISDNQILNLTPFEVRFDENRQFFTEGVELFNKGGFFYSRRIGGNPLNAGNLSSRLTSVDSILSNPGQTQLVNATKISGRNQNGLGLGFFNAVEAPTYAEVLDKETGEKRQVLTSPLTNYNVSVVDQNLKNNSFVTLINTNVWRAGADYDANLTGTVFTLRNKENSYAVSGTAALSQQYFPDSIGLGHTYNLNLAKTSGEWQWELNYNEESDTYDPNDLGFLLNNNERSANAGIRYRRYEPFGRFIRGGAELWLNYRQLYAPNYFTSFGINLEGWMMTEKFFAFGAWTYIEPVPAYDYFDSRQFGLPVLIPASANTGAWISTDYRKKFAIDVRSNFRKFDQENRYRWSWEISPRFRFNDRFSLIASTDHTIFEDDIGYAATTDAGVPIVGIRDRHIIENSMRLKYTFTNRMNLNVRMRHYWSSVTYNSLHELNEDGTLKPTEYDNFEDNSFNAFNIDAIYRWRFAPGSDIFIIWKNTILNYADDPEDVRYAYTGSVNDLGLLPQRNSLSVKIIFFLDYFETATKIKNGELF